MAKLTKKQLKSKKFREKKTEKEKKTDNLKLDETSKLEEAESKVARVSTATESAASKPSAKKRFIAFVGNIAYDAKESELLSFFKMCSGNPSVRFLTDKETGKPKGFAFVEFDNSKSLEAALALNDSFFKTRRLKIELTAGGGGSSDNRKQKIKTKNEKYKKEAKTPDLLDNPEF